MEMMYILYEDVDGGMRTWTLSSVIRTWMMRGYV
jgi:hypothetical protein